MSLELRRIGKSIGQYARRREARNAVQTVGDAPAHHLDGEMPRQLVVGGHGDGRQGGGGRRCVAVGGGQNDGDGRLDDGQVIVIVGGIFGMQRWKVRAAVYLGVEILGGIPCLVKVRWWHGGWVIATTGLVGNSGMGKWEMGLVECFA